MTALRDCRLRPNRSNVKALQSPKMPMAAQPVRTGSPRSSSTNMGARSGQTELGDQGLPLAQRARLRARHEEVLKPCHGLMRVQTIRGTDIWLRRRATPRFAGTIQSWPHRDRDLGESGVPARAFGAGHSRRTALKRLHDGHQKQMHDVKTGDPVVIPHGSGDPRSRGRRPWQNVVRLACHACSA